MDKRKKINEKEVEKPGTPETPDNDIDHLIDKGESENEGIQGKLEIPVKWRSEKTKDGKIITEDPDNVIVWSPNAGHILRPRKELFPGN